MAVFLNLRVIYSWSLYEFGIEITSHQEVDCFLRPALELLYNSILHAETALRRRKLKDLLALQLLQLIPETWPWTNDGVDCRFNESCLFKFQPSYCCVIISCARWWDDTRETIARERRSRARETTNWAVSLWIKKYRQPKLNDCERITKCWAVWWFSHYASHWILKQWDSRLRLVLLNLARLTIVYVLCHRLICLISTVQSTMFTESPW